MKLAVIADDFTGGADAASFLKRKDTFNKTGYRHH